MKSINEIRTRVKSELGLSHTNTEDFYIDMCIDESIDQQNDLIRLKPAHCCVDVVKGLAPVPEGMNTLICASIGGTEYVYVNKMYFSQYDLECTHKSVNDTQGTVKKYNDTLDFGGDISGEAHIYYKKYNKIGERFVIPDECYLSAVFYACYRYTFQQNNPKWQHYALLWEKYKGDANNRVQTKESKEAYAETRAVLNDMFYGSRIFRINNVTMY